jgi:hypothetical protein
MAPHGVKQRAMPAPGGLARLRPGFDGAQGRPIVLSFAKLSDRLGTLLKVLLLTGKRAAA